MKKTYKMEDLECAVCAQKMEDAISRIDGVNSVSISFVLQQMRLDADDDKLEDVLKQAAKVCKKIERNCRIVI